jgi:hypothetical protein
MFVSRFKSIFKKFKIFLFFSLLQIKFFMFIDNFNMLILKIILKKYYFNVFSSKNYFKI